MLIHTTFAAGERKEFFDPGDFFRLLEATDPVTVTFYLNGAEVAEAEGVVDGYAEKFRVGTFDRFAITSATAQSLQFVARLGNDVGYDKAPNGDVTVTNVNGAFSHAVVATSTTSVQLAAANAQRRYLLIQNNDTAADVYVRLDGAAATVGSGIKLAAGGSSLELQGYVPTGQINAITAGSTANLIVVEG